MQTHKALWVGAFILISVRLIFSQTPTLFVQQGPRYPSALCVNKDGSLAATADSDGVRVYDLPGQRQIRTLQHFAVKSVAFSADGNILASAGQDEPSSVASGSVHYSIKLWRLSTGELVKRLSVDSLTTNLSAQFYSVAFSPDGNLMAASAIDNTIRIWNTNDYGSPKIIQARNSLLSISFSPDSSTLAGGGYHHLLGTWRVDDGQLKALSAPGAGDTNVTVVSFSPDGKILATAGADRKITLWDLGSGGITAIMSASSSVQSLDFSPDGEALLSTDGAGTVLWDVKAALLTRGNAPPIRKFRDPDDSTLIALRFVGNDRYVAADLYQNRLQMWKLKEEKPSWTITASADGIDCLRFELNGTILVSEGAAGARLWDYKEGELRRALNQHFICPMGENALASPDLSVIASKGMTNIPINAMTDSHLVKTLEVKDGADNSFTTALAFSQDGKLLVSGTLGGFIRLWDLTTGTPILTRNVNPPPRYLETFGTTRIQDPATIFPAVVSALAVNKQATLLAGIADNGSQVGKIRFWKLPDGTEIESLWDLRGFVTAMSFDEGGKVFAAGFATGSIVVWDLAARTVRWRQSGHTGRISSLLFDSAKGLLISGASDGQVKMWRLDSGEEVLSLVAPTDSEWLAVATNGLFDGTAMAMKYIGWRIGNTNEVASMESFYDDFFTPGLFGQVLNGDVPAVSADIATTLQIPGLRTMLSEGKARFVERNGKETLCLPALPTAKASFKMLVNAQPTAFDASQIIQVPNDLECPVQFQVDSSKHYEFFPVTQPTKATVPHLAYDHKKTDVVGNAVLHVQTIAIGNYDSRLSGFPGLPSLVLQAQQFAEVFSAADKARLLPYKTLKVWDGLFDSAATTSGILARLHEIAETAKPEDVVVLLFSGHGTIPAGQEMFYFVTSDTKGPDPMAERDTGLSTAMITEALRAIPARRVMLIIDSCQSGGALEPLSKIAQVKASEAAHSGSERNKNIATDQEIGLYLIAAASPLDEAVQPTSADDALVGGIIACLRQPSDSHMQTIWASDVANAVNAANRNADKAQRTSFMTISTGLDFPLIGNHPLTGQ
jgi:WD40 repeat protein